LAALFVIDVEVMTGFPYGHDNSRTQLFKSTWKLSMAK
jgi:hypothetical protein